MLTADLVETRKRGGELVLRQLDADGRAEALLLAERYLELARDGVGKRRAELEEGWGAVASTRPKLAAGLRKLCSDACDFEAEIEVDPVDLRRVLFTRASHARRTSAGGHLDRDLVVAEAAAELGVSSERVERGLFADLRDEHVLRSAPGYDARTLVEAWEMGRAQAVLLTAVRVACDVPRASPGAVRSLFAKLKFHRLLFQAVRTDDGYRVVIEGPYAMFDAVTKYGLQLACLLPALRELERWTLVADVRWGRAREPLVFRVDHHDGARDGAESELHLSDEARELAAAVNAIGEGWRAEAASEILDVPGTGVCVPDLVLVREGRRVFVEILGYWSRDAVFRRVELAESGLGAPVLFAVSSRLRVSEEVLTADVPASLYVYKGKIHPRAVLERAARLVTDR